VEAARVTVELAVEASTQKATAARECTATLARDVKDRGALAEREAWERVLKVEAESATTLASAREEAEGHVRRIALLKGDLVEAHHAWNMAEENSWGLSVTVIDAERRREEFERES
jgi:hypothetical protein